MFTLLAFAQHQVSKVETQQCSFYLQVAVALGLLTAEVTAAPFNNLVCTFSASPVLHEVKGDKLTEKVCTQVSLPDWLVVQSTSAVQYSTTVLSWLDE